MIFIPLTLVPYNPPPGSYGSSSTYYGGISASFGGYSAGGGAVTTPVVTAPPEPPPPPPPEPIFIAAHSIYSLSPNADGTCFVGCGPNGYHVHQSKDEILGLIDAMLRGAQVG